MILTTYTLYILLSIIITVWVGYTLSSNGKIFLIEIFSGDDHLAHSVNHLLLVGFYLVNAGFVTLTLKYGVKPNDMVEAIEFLSTKIGMVIIVLGLIHFFNIRSLIKFRESGIFKALGGTEIMAEGAYETK